MTEPIRYDFSLLTADDLYLLNEGSHFRLYDKLGAHLVEHDGQTGTYFAVWAPDAEKVFVMGDFNGWKKTSHPLVLRDQAGIWEGFVPGIGQGAVYKFYIVSRLNNYRVDKADAFGFKFEEPPQNASIVWDLAYIWGDQDWMQGRQRRIALDAPISIYEIHLGSWRRRPEEGNRFLSYREVAPLLADYMLKMGFTHVEFLPLTEHPFYGSWGYQTTGYFAPTSRYGNPQDFMYLVDYLHQHNIGVILDWVPSHFPADESGPGFFDGSYLFEHADPRKGYHPEWHSFIFNYGRNEVRNFLLSSALFWLDKYHLDGLRLDAVASMLYLDYSRKPGEWIPNQYGGNENLEAIAFLKKFNEVVYQNYPDVQTVAEESTAWPLVSRPLYLGGLSFGFKWDMGWMHDTLEYFSRDPLFRKYAHNALTFRILYAYQENFILPLSHDEVVFGKGSLLRKMPGDDWQKFANLRLLFGYMFSQPGKKLLFMGGEFGQWDEWYHEKSLDWHLTQSPAHIGVQRWVEDLNQFYRREPALYEKDFSPEGFAWVDFKDIDHSIIAYLRRGREPGETILAVLNFTPVVYQNYRVGVPVSGFWREILNSDAPDYGGSGQGNFGGVEAFPIPAHGHYSSLNLTLPPLGIVFLKHQS